MSAIFDLEQELHSEGFDLSVMRTAWMELSAAKGWPTTAIGWERYCRRTLDTGKGPMRPQEKPKIIVMVPAEFSQWWAGHADASVHPVTKEISPTARIAWDCACYREEWKQGRQTARRAA